jgi:ATP-binding cassette subfamily B protein
MVAAHYGRSMGLAQLRAMCYIDREGVNMLGISEAAEALGLRTMAVKCSIDKLYDDAPLPFIAHWRQRHFVVVIIWVLLTVLMPQTALA